MKLSYKTPIITGALLLAFTLLAQSQKPLPDPDRILAGQRQQPTVLPVGSFHFAYYNLDAHKTEKDQQVDILSAQKQKEMEVLVSYLKKFRPTKIAVESDKNTGYIMKRYRAYKRKEKPLDRDEIDQICFRLMETFNLDTIYGVDAETLSHDLKTGKDSTAFRPMLDSIYADWDFQSDDSISNRYEQYYKSDEQLALRMSLLDYFKYTNSDKILHREFGAYLAGDFTLGDTRGADALAMGWYCRNLRIYRHIQQITTSPSDRILVLFGRGHIQILKHLFECSPEYKLIKFGDLK
jgi:hypothetical protein